MSDLTAYFSGKALYGDDFTTSEIERWYQDETEGYADLVDGEKNQHNYVYHNFNRLNGFAYLPKTARFERVLGVGAAFGFEYEPLKNQIGELFLLEPSEQLVSKDIFGIPFSYHKPTVSGEMAFEDNFFDMITSFGTLHHIPNVSKVMAEMTRTLKPGGYLLVREPIISMGDWRQSRTGLTKRERGIPLAVFQKMIADLPLRVVSEIPCLTMTPFLVRKTAGWFAQPIYAYMPYLVFDRVLSQLTLWNLHYHATNIFQRIAPTNVFYVLQKV